MPSLIPNPKMTLALVIPASHEPSHVCFGSDRTSVHEVFLRGERPGLAIEARGCASQSDPVHRLLMICE
jgi:hypothetical protein